MQRSAYFNFFFKRGVLPYIVDKRFISPVTIIFFIRSQRTNRRTCIKKWPRGADPLFRVADDPNNFANLQEGLAFNRRFAPGIYLGIAPIAGIEPHLEKIERGRIIKKPRAQDIQPDQEYAIVMKPLREEWRLDNWLDRLATAEGMRFLAEKVAHIHRQVDRSTHELGKPQYLQEKLETNIELFEQTLNHLAQQGCEIEQYRPVSDVMRRFISNAASDFDRRYEEGHVRRCHGDLKTINLWLKPVLPFPGCKLLWRSRLLPLDCIDFNPLLCNIDTLSDVAMLAVDLEVRLQLALAVTTGERQTEVLEKWTSNLVEVFLKHYLLEMKENRGAVWHLLEYYMAEKAMACTHAFIMYYGELELGKMYLKALLPNLIRVEQNEVYLEVAELGKMYLRRAWAHAQHLLPVHA